MRVKVFVTNKFQVNLDPALGFVIFWKPGNPWEWGCFQMTVNAFFQKSASLWSRSLVESRYNKPPSNKVLDSTDGFVNPSYSKIYGKEPRYNETSLYRTYFASPWPLVISRFYSTAQARKQQEKKKPIWGAKTADIVMLNKNGKGTELFKITFTVEHPIH